MSFEVDIHEPLEIVRLLDTGIDLNVTSLNAAGWADYRYDAAECFCHKSTIYNIERKTWQDFVNGIEDVEEQLGRQLDLHPGVHHKLIVEGVVEPAMKGMLIYRKSQGKNVMTAGLLGNQQQTYKHIVNWLHQVSKYWDVVYTHSMASTATLIAAHYDADQTDEDQHRTFHRMFKQRHYQMDPQAERILGAAGATPFGEVRAHAVAKHFGTAWRAFKAPMEEWTKVEGIGSVTAKNYLRGIGRPDV